jgi:hypothetical protein
MGRLRAVSAPGWDATAVRRVGNRCGAPPVTSGQFSRRPCCEARQQPSQRWGSWRPASAGRGSGAADCAAPGWGLWHPGGPAWVAQAGLAGGRQEQAPWARADITPGPRAVAANGAPRPRVRRRPAAPSLLPDYAAADDSHAQGEGRVSGGGVSDDLSRPCARRPWPMPTTAAP